MPGGMPSPSCLGSCDVEAAILAEADRIGNLIGQLVDTDVDAARYLPVIPSLLGMLALAAAVYRAAHKTNSEGSRIRTLAFR
jgi:hypothetical protein